MIMNYTTVEESLGRVKRTVVKLAAETTIMITLFSFTELDAQASEKIAYTLPTDNQIEAVTTLDNNIVSMPVEIEQNRVAVLMEQLRFDTVDKLTDAFFSLHLDAGDYHNYRPLFIQMAMPLSKIDIVKATADIDPDDQSLELVLLLSKGVMVSVEKPADTMGDDNALVTFVHQQEVLYSGVMDLSRLSASVQEIVSKLQAI